MLRLTVLIITLLFFIIRPGLANAQGDIDAQLVKAMDAMKGAWTECTSKKFLECVTVEKQLLGVTGNLARTVNKRDERTEIKVRAWSTPADTQRSFQLDVDSTRKPPTNTVPPIQFWRTETFDAVPGQKDSGVLAASLSPNPDTAYAGAFGVLICGNLTASFSMNLFESAGISIKDKSLVDATQSQLKGLMLQLGGALAGVCQGGAASAQDQLKISRIDADSPNRGFGAPIRFEEGALVQIRVGTSTKDPNKNTYAAVAGVKFQVFYDNTLAGSGQTPSGAFSVFGSVTFSLPADTPQGRSQHQIKVQVSKENYLPAEATRQVEVERGLEKTKMLMEPLAGEYDVNQSVTVRGKVFDDGPKPWGSIPVAATVSVSDLNGKLLGTTVTQTGGSFSLGVQVGKATIGGVFNLLVVRAVPSDTSHHEDVESDLPLKMKPGKTLLLTLGTDKGVYRQGETVAVHGTSTSQGNPVSVQVQLSVDSVPQGSKTTGADGTFSFAFVPPNVPGQIPAPGGQHLVVASAKANGYDDGAATSYFLVGGEALTCVPLPFDVLNIKGQPIASSLIPPDTIPPLTSGATPKASPIAAGNKLTQDMSVRTGADDQVTLSLPFEGGQVRIGVDAKTELKIGSFCKDASGKIKLVLSVDNPGKILVNIDNPGGASSPLDYKIITPRTAVNSVNTRYAVAVDDQGATTVASFDGVVLVSDLQNANTVRVETAKQLTVPIGNAPNQVQVTTRTLAIDPALEEMLKQAPTTPRAPSSSSPIATLTSNPLVLLGVAGFALVGFGGLILGLLLVARSRRQTGSQARALPTDLPEQGRTRGRSKPPDLPR